MTSKRNRLRELLRVIEATEAEELNCDEFLARVAPLLEAVEAETEVPDELRPAVQHLSVCPECKEEFEALLRAHGIPA